MTAIDEKEIARLRAEHPTMKSKDAWELLPALLDEVERLRGEIAAKSWAANDRHNDELRYFAVGEKLAKERAEKAERDRDEARANLGVESQALTETFRMMSEARAQAAAMRARAAQLRDELRYDGWETTADEAQAVIDAGDTGRDVLDALAKAEAALRGAQRIVGAYGVTGGPNVDAVAAALAAIQALGISKERT